LAATIAPHLARAFEVSHRLASIPRGNVQLAALIDRIAGPALIVDRNRRVRLANIAGETLLRSARGIRLDRDGSVALADATENAGLAVALRTCFDPAAAAAPCDIRFNTGEGGRVSWLNVVPLVADDSTGKGPLARFLADRERLALLIVSTPWEPSLDTAARLRAAFLMTPAEVMLALALMEGVSLDSYARDRGITINTARKQLKSLFEKTGTHRQGELVAALFAELGRRGRF
jgi:DNA-binding CsgD family transcriptional regulator